MAMSEVEKFTLEEAHKEFAKRTNGQVWQLLEKAERTQAEDEEMVLAAYACLYHWLHAGTEVNRQRGEWLIARVHTVLGEDAPALQHARRCLELSEAYRDQMKDFDIAYAYEGMARAHALGGDRATARQYLEKAGAAGRAIANSEDKEIFMRDFEGGAWYGLR
jgi:tetratricopeptide (TPR) repeat protein